MDRTSRSPPGSRGTSLGRPAQGGRTKHLKSGEKISVAVRIRPALHDAPEPAFVAEQSAKVILELDSVGDISSSLQFDHAFGGTSSTEEVYQEVGERLIRRGLEGFNGCLLAYGQTASGKTHTLMGSPDEPGIIPRAVFGVFDAIAEAKHSHVVVRVSYIEVYNEELRDLFAHSEASERGGLRIVDEPKTGPWVRGAVSAVATSPDHVMSLLEFGEAQRAYGATNMNEHSSRSHVLFRMTIKRGFTAQPSEVRASDEDELVNEIGPAWEQDPSVAVQASAVNFVDLAGSERLKKTGATGQALKEANHINTSLMTLGTVIAKLTSGDERAHIPYRDSKLTQLLSASLGGNSGTTLIACVSPAEKDREESTNTLRYATRARSIVNGGAANGAENMEAFMESFKAEIAGLKQELWQRGEEIRARDDEVARLSAIADEQRGDFLREIDSLQEQLAGEQSKGVGGGDRGAWEEEMALEKQLWQEQKSELEVALAEERTINHKRIEELMAQVTAKNSGDISVVHAALRDEVHRLKAEKVDGGGSGGGLPQQRPTEGSDATLAKLLVVADRQLKDSQQQVTKLRAELVRAQKEALTQGRVMAEELNGLRKELRGFAASHVEHSNFDVPEGYVLWFHAHTLPRIFSLAAPENAHVLLRPHAAAPVAARTLPLGVTVEVDANAVAVAKASNPLLLDQMTRLVPSSLSEKTFWLNFFSHVHAIKAHVASLARARAAQMGGALDPQLKETFSAVLREGILLRCHDHVQGSVALVKLWLSDYGTLSVLGDGESEPVLLSLRNVVKVTTGKASAQSSAIDELAFTLKTSSVDMNFEASARLERQALVEGFRMLLSEH